MENIETIVRERNKAYFDLEVGGVAEPERPGAWNMSLIGLPQFVHKTDHHIPKVTLRFFRITFHICKTSIYINFL